MAFDDQWGYDYGEVLFIGRSRRGKAYGFRDGATGQTFWIPLTQMHQLSEVPGKRRGMLIVKTWIAQQKGWIDEARYNLKGVTP